jgi:hypothetical protein
MPKKSIPYKPAAGSGNDNTNAKKINPNTNFTILP